MYKAQYHIIVNDWLGRVVQANFAVIDCAKKYDKGGDIHSHDAYSIPTLKRYAKAGGI